LRHRFECRAQGLPAEPPPFRAKNSASFFSSLYVPR
jgi:hypothetical protein